MSAAVSMLSIEELLHAVKPHHYLAVWRGQSGIQYAVVEPGGWFLVLPDQSVRVADVKIKPLDVSPPNDVLGHPRVKWLSEFVGKPPVLRLYQYTFTLFKTRVVQRLNTGDEFHEVTQEPASSPVVVHVVHVYYVAYVSNRGHIYSETPGGAQAYRLIERSWLRPPQVYIRRFDKHRYEVGVKIAIDEEQVRQLIRLLGGA